MLFLVFMMALAVSEEDLDGPFALEWGNGDAHQPPTFAAARTTAEVFGVVPKIFVVTFAVRADSWRWRPSHAGG